ncbi:hypothetical protein E1301_Tti004092 [Triplophysa tibetana]|uniref:Ribonuclease A-domain domain-containing protein n=1 Tax=Triplophysa tibetana TaxID=1572043 RepID=A0A5A9NJB0_9TELE|nr:hypothetical protein E1301_Tti004092 [Triplophysa tibetana]
MDQSSVILLLVLCASLSIDAQPAKYFTFVKQHVSNGMRKHMCTTEIANKNIRSFNGCKPVNTFINALDDQVRAVCTGGGQNIGGNLFRSSLKFDVVKCNQIPGTMYPGCQYTGFEKSLVHIVLACENRWPVHFERFG